MHLQLILILLFFIFPVFVIFLTGKSKLANRIGVIIIVYGFGLFIGNVGIIPTAGNYLKDYIANTNGVNLSDVFQKTRLKFDLRYFPLAFTVIQL